MKAIKNGTQLKRLQSVRDSLLENIDSLELKIKYLSDEVKNLKLELDTVNKKINSIKENRKIIVSEHAILRYFERVLNIDIKAIINKIENDENLLDKFEKLGNGTYPINGGEFHVLIKNNVVVTVLAND